MVLYGVAAVVAVCSTALFVAASIDYIVRIQHHGTRLLGSLAVLAALVASVRQFLLPALRRSWSEIEVARRIERRFPQLSDRLSSSIAFLHQPADDPTAGSVELRRAVIARTTDEVGKLNLSAVIDSRRPWRMVFVALPICLAIVSLAFAFPSETRLAVKRILLPWGNDGWPRVHHLAFVNPPQRIAIGSNLELELADRNDRLPNSVRIYCWHEGEEEAAVWPREMTLRGRNMVYRLETVMRRMKYRAVGGDDESMPWQRLDVVEPPRVESLHFELIPPAYTGWPTWGGSRRQLRVLEGTQVRVVGRSTKPLAQARLKVVCGEEEAERPATLGPDRHAFRLPGDLDTSWVVRKSGEYWFDFVDIEGVRGGTEDRWQVRAIPDRAPTIKIELPAAHSFVTAGAVVPFRALVKDDLAIETIELRFTRSDRPAQEDDVITLYRGPQPIPPSRDRAQDDLATDADYHTVDYAWDLAQREDLVPGTLLTLRLVASDFKAQETRSPARRVTIITADQLQERMARGQSQILERLTRVLRQQQDIRGQVSGLEIEVVESGRLDSPGVDQLRNAEFNQRELKRRLAADNDSVQRQIDSLLDEVETNRLSLPETRKRMLQLAQTITLLDREDLPIIQRNLRDGLHEAQDSLAQSTSKPADRPTELAAPSRARAASSASLLASLRAAGRRQDKVVATLQQLLGELKQWASYRQLLHDADSLYRDQGQLARQINALRPRMLSKQLLDLSAQERSGLVELSTRQFEIARRLDKLLSRMQLARDQLAATGPLAAGVLADALETAVRLGISGQMRRCQQSIQHNHMGQIVDQQKQVSEALEEFLRILANHHEHDPARRADRLGKASADPEDLWRQQEDLIRQQLARMVQMIQDMIQRQRNVMDEAARLQILRNQQGQWTEAQRIRQMIKETWGHLPATLREPMMSVELDSFLPKYETLIKQYFQRMAEERDGPR